MPLSILAPKLARAALCVLIGLCIAAGATAQTLIEYDWENRIRIACPVEIDRNQMGKVVVRGVNNILFKYRLDIIETRHTVDDWQKLSDLIGSSPGVAPAADEFGRAGCQEALRDAQLHLEAIREIVRKDPALPLGYKASRRRASVRLIESLAAWDRIERLRAPLRGRVSQLENCGGSSNASFLRPYREINEQLNGLEKIVRGPHEISSSIIIRPNTDYRITVEETFEGEKTEEGELTFVCSPKSARFTLTAGTLFSQIADRDYEARNIPGMIDNVLMVESNSAFKPKGVALLNYFLPPLQHETAGLALSAGPVIRFGSKSDLSTLGFFTGVSGHLYRRIYLTPGFHFGEFADFPAGLREGSAVPADFDTLTPAKRWTTRFAFAITFRITSFNGR